MTLTYNEAIAQQRRFELETAALAQKVETAYDEVERTMEQYTLTFLGATNRVDLGQRSFMHYANRHHKGTTPAPAALPPPTPGPSSSARGSFPRTGSTPTQTATIQRPPAPKGGSEQTMERSRPSDTKTRSRTKTSTGDPGPAPVALTEEELLDPTSESTLERRLAELTNKTPATSSDSPFEQRLLALREVSDVKPEEGWLVETDTAISEESASLQRQVNALTEVVNQLAKAAALPPAPAAAETATAAAADSGEDVRLTEELRVAGERADAAHARAEASEAATAAATEVARAAEEKVESTQAMAVRQATAAAARTAVLVKAATDKLAAQHRQETDSLEQAARTAEATTAEVRARSDERETQDRAANEATVEAMRAAEATSARLSSALEATTAEAQESVARLRAENEAALKAASTAQLAEISQLETTHAAEVKDKNVQLASLRSEEAAHRRVVRTLESQVTTANAKTTRVETSLATANRMVKQKSEAVVATRKLVAEARAIADEALDSRDSGKNAVFLGRLATAEAAAKAAAIAATTAEEAKAAIQAELDESRTQLEDTQIELGEAEDGQTAAEANLAASEATFTEWRAAAQEQFSAVEDASILNVDRAFAERDEAMVAAATAGQQAADAHAALAAAATGSTHQPTANDEDLKHLRGKLAETQDQLQQATSSKRTQARLQRRLAKQTSRVEELSQAVAEKDDAIAGLQQTYTERAAVAATTARGLKRATTAALRAKDVSDRATSAAEARAVEAETANARSTAALEAMIQEKLSTSASSSSKQEIETVALRPELAAHGWTSMDFSKMARDAWKMMADTYAAAGVGNQVIGVAGGALGHLATATGVMMDAGNRVVGVLLPPTQELLGAGGVLAFNAAGQVSGVFIAAAPDVASGIAKQASAAWKLRFAAARQAGLVGTRTASALGTAASASASAAMVSGRIVAPRLRTAALGTAAAAGTGTRFLATAASTATSAAASTVVSGAQTVASTVVAGVQTATPLVKHAAQEATRSAALTLIDAAEATVNKMEELRAAAVVRHGVWVKERAALARANARAQRTRSREENAAYKRELRTMDKQLAREQESIDAFDEDVQEVVDDVASGLSVELPEAQEFVLRRSTRAKTPVRPTTFEQNVIGGSARRPRFGQQRMETQAPDGGIRPRGRR